MSESLIKNLRKQYSSLVAERDDILPVWKDLANNFLPLKRVLLEEEFEQNDIYNEMGRVNNHILDGTPIKSIRVLGAGMQSGITSPAKRWFRLGHPNPEIEKIPVVKEWLEQAQNSVFNTMSRSNFYNSTHRCYVEAGVFGTLVMLVLDDDEKAIRTIPLSAGGYVIAANFKQEVDTLFRDIFMTAKQLVNEFGKENVSQKVKNAWDNQDTKGNWFPVIHAILPNEDFDPEKEDIPSMLYKSVYFEENPDDTDKDKALREGGFKEKPFIAARWDVTGQNVYGDSPAMDVLAFAKELQAEKSTLLKALQKEVDPPMNVPPNMKDVSIAPGAMNYSKYVNEKIEPTLNIKTNPQNTIIVIQEAKKEIREGLFNDIFKALALSPGGKMTATEVMERVSEGLRLLGPVLERLQFEFLDPLIDRVFAINLRAGLFPPVPEELEGTQLKTEYISPLAQAQKAAGTDALTKLLNFTGAIAGLFPEVVDNVDFDEMTNIYADLVGASPTVLNDEQEVEEIRKLRDEQRQAALDAQQASQQTEDLKKMSETEVTPGVNAIESAASAGAS